MKRPLLRWAGSKRVQLPLIERFWPASFARYVEPFCGSCAALFHRLPPLAVMNDINPELINFWRMIKAHPRELHAAADALPNSELTYYEMRAREPTELRAIERAVRFLYLNRYSFNGLYRTNRFGIYNVPYGGRRCGTLPPLAVFLAHSQAVKVADFSCTDFAPILLDSARKDAFVYLDPPYAVKGSRVSGEYDQTAFRYSDFERLVPVLAWLDEIGAKFLLSYAADERVAKTLGAYLRGQYDVRRRISGFRRGRTTTEEFVFSNYEPAT